MRVKAHVNSSEYLPPKAPSYGKHHKAYRSRKRHPSEETRLTTSTVYLLRPPLSVSSSSSSTAPWIISETNSQLRHPLTSKRHVWNRPRNIDLSKFHPTALAVSYHASSSFDKLLLFPVPKSSNPNYNYDKHTIFALYHSGELKVRRYGGAWEYIWGSGGGCDKFDDIVIYKGKIYVLNREGKLNLINDYRKTRKITIGKTLINREFGRFGWRKRLVVDGNEMYLVVRKENKLFVVYKMVRRGKTLDWEKVEGFDGRKVLFMAKDYCFLRRAATRFPGRKYKNCIVFSEWAFPKYGDYCWEFSRSEDDVAVFRLGDGCFGREGENEEFPRINWLPSWIFGASLDSAGGFQCRSLSESYSQSESEPDEDKGLDTNSVDEKDGEVQSDLKDSNSKDENDVVMPSCVNIESEADNQDEKDGQMQCDLKDSNSKNVNDSNSQDVKDGEKGMESDYVSKDEEVGQMQCDSNSQEKEDGKTHSTANIECVASLQEDIPPSLSGPESETTDIVTASLSATEEEVTRTLLSMNGGNDAIVQETSRTNISQSVLRACSSSTTKSHKSASFTTSTAKFEGFDIRSDLVPTLQKIWLKHGNIIENSTMRSGDMIGKALESLATMVRILEDNSAQSLSGSQVDYLNYTLSDLRCICFKVYWLIPFVEKAVQLHKSKPLLDSLNNLSQLRSQVKERRAILFDEFAKLGEEESKLKEEMEKLSKMILISGQIKFDEPLGLGLT